MDTTTTDHTYRSHTLKKAIAQSVSLVYTHHGRAALFEGILAPSKVLLVAPGDAKRLFNLIFLVDFLPEEGQSRTGSVVSTNDSTREITLASTDGSKRENFVGVLPRSYGFQNPRRHKDYGSFFRRNDWTGTGQDASLLAVRPANEVSGV